MKKPFKFKNLEEMYEEMPLTLNKRPQDILIDGKSIFKQPKTQAQFEIIKTASRLVDEYIKKLGIKHRPFNPKRIIFLSQKLNAMAAEQYHDGDFLFIDETSEANLGTIIHGFIHAQSAEWRNYDEEKLEKFLEENKKSAKSGFHRHTNFKTINEGITEKITREIVNNNPNEYDKLKPLFAGRMEQFIAEREKEFKEKILPKKIKEKEEQIIKQQKRIEELKKRLIADITEIDQQISQAQSEKEKEILWKIRKGYEDGLKRDIQSIFDLKKLFDPVKYAHEIHALKIQKIKTNYNFTPSDMISYDFNVEIINNLIEGMAKYNLKIDKNLNLDEERKKVWKDLQRSYFSGNIMYLRKIDEVFDQGFLKKIDKFNQLLIKREQNDFLEEIKNKVNNI